jgi:acyl-CoA synthetase (AMP-forming)/AMP-acid ligase II
MTNLGYYIHRAAGYWPDNDAVVCDDFRVSFAELDARAASLAAALADAGVGKQTAVATFSNNRGELVEIEYALYTRSALRVPINSRLGVNEAAHILKDSDSTLLFVDEPHRESAEAAIAIAGTSTRLIVFGGEPEVSYEAFMQRGSGAQFSDVRIDAESSTPSVLHFTSGSTGRLKAATQTVGNRLANMRKRLMMPESEIGATCRYLVAGPITHASGMGILAALSRGTAIIVLQRWSAEAFFRTVRDERVTATFLVPTMLHAVLEHGVDAQDVSSLRSLKVGGAPVSPQRLRDAVAAFGPIVGQGFGQAETTSGVTVLSAEDVIRGIEGDPELLLSCGRGIFDTELAIFDDDMNRLPAGEKGELAVRGPDCVTGYWNAPELTAQTFVDGWVMSGDIAYMRPDGFVVIVDRKKDMIISGGFNIYSTEVEAILYEHPHVAEACVVGEPSEKWGESVRAVITLKPGAVVPEQELIDFCASRLDSFKKPRAVDFVDSLPVNRKSVKERYWAGALRGVS